MRWRYGLGMAAIWLLCLVAAIVGLVWLAASIVKEVATGAEGRRAWRLSIAFDQLANTAAGGDEDETISARSYRYRKDPPYRWLLPLIDRVASLCGEPDHCHGAYVAEILKAQARLAEEHF